MCNPEFKSADTVAKDGSVKSTTTTKLVSPAVSSGHARRRRFAIAAATTGLIVFYRATVWLFRDSGTWLRPADEYCREEAAAAADENGTCSRPDLFAKTAASAVMQLYAGGMGLVTWHVTKRVVTGIPQTPEGRLFGYLEEADMLSTGIVVYQTFDFFSSMFVPEHYTAIFLAHHALAAFAAWMSLEFQMVHYYAIFFGGCSEISTIFLVVCDFDVYFPADDRGSTWGTVVAFCQVAFTVSFLYYRVIGWWQVSFGLWSDVYRVAQKGVIEHYRPGKAWFLYGFLVMDFLLGSLQLYWFFFGIAPKILEILAE